MLVAAVRFSDFILAVHILAVVIGFGVTFMYPLIFAAARRADPRVMPYLWSTVARIDRYVVNPALLVVLVAGIYLAADKHRFSAFFVQWGFAAVIVIGGVVGGYLIPRETKLAEISEREVAEVTSGGGGSAAPMTWSPEYRKLEKRVATMGAVLDLIVVVTVFVMATHAGA